MAPIVGSDTDQVLRGTGVADSIYGDAADDIVKESGSLTLSNDWLLGLGGNDVFVRSPHDGRGNVFVGFEGGEGTDLGSATGSMCAGSRSPTRRRSWRWRLSAAGTPSSSWALPPASPWSASSGSSPPA